MIAISFGCNVMVLNLKVVGPTGSAARLNVCGRLACVLVTNTAFTREETFAPGAASTSVVAAPLIAVH